MKIFTVKIRGNSPYMQHRMDDLKLEEWEVKRGFIIERDDIAHDDLVRAEYHCYRNSDKKCFLPSSHIKGALIEAGKLVKGKVGNATKNMSNIVAGMFRVAPEQIILPDYDIVDKRSAVNQNVKARVITIRPLWTNWEVIFTLQVRNDTITIQTISNIIKLAGESIGIGSYRPSKKGEFGCFDLISIDPLLQNTEDITA